MTIAYRGRFMRLLFKWRASLWQCVWKELTIFLVLFYSLFFVYKFGLPADHKKTFGKVVQYLDETVSTSIPISYLLGMYVVTITRRWWDQFENIGWPDELMYFTSAYVVGNDDESLMIRRNVARYAVLAAALAWRNLSTRVQKRFPTAKHLTGSGLMTEEELSLYENFKSPYGRWYLPINWIQSIFLDMKQKGRIDGSELRQLLTTLHYYRNKFFKLFVGDWISIPLIYTQVATITTYGYFAICLIGRQPLDERDSIDKFHMHVYFPFQTVLQFLLYIGWLKIAEKLLHPFGDEDDDFELNYILDRHLYVSFVIVDDLHCQLPPQKRDTFWGSEPFIPHTKASGKILERKPLSHASGMNLPFKEMEFTVDRQKSLTRRETSHTATRTTSALAMAASTLLFNSDKND